MNLKWQKLSPGDVVGSIDNVVVGSVGVNDTTGTE